MFIKLPRVLLFSMMLYLSLASATSWAQQFERVAHFEQWPGISQLISYRDRVWFVNSMPYRDSNVADIYSYSLDQGSLRYERSLFSQDVGDPVIYNGLLYWPFEDPRRSAGTGEYAVTDGAHWDWRVMQSGSVMHVHAMSVCDGNLVATTGSWSGQLHRLSDQQPVSESLTEQWEIQYDYPAGNASFSRLVSVAQFGGKCIVGASARGKDETKLFTIQGDKPEAIGHWPKSDRVDTLVPHKADLFAFSDTGQTRQLLRYDGSQVHQMDLPSNHRPRTMHSDGQFLWLATQNRQDKTMPGALWKLGINHQFELIQKISQVPDALAVHKGTLVIGTYASTGGELWLYKDKPQALAGKEKTVTSLQANNRSATYDTELEKSLFAELQAVIANPESTTDRARILRRHLGRHAYIETPEFGTALTRLLSLPLNGEPIKMFNGQLVSYENLIRWYLITTLAINGHGRIDPALLRSSQELIVPDSAKLFDPTIAAIVATGWLRQSDNETLAALIERLNKETDPLWVKADIIGALSALTNKRFAYDVAAWNAWWNEYAK